MIKRTTLCDWPKAGMCWEIGLTDDIGDLRSFWPRTDSLRDAACYAFQCADVLEVWCTTVAVARGTQPLFIALMDEASSPVMLLALGIERRKRIKVLTFLDGGVCDYAAPILFPNFPDWGMAEAQILWNKIQRLLPAYDVAVLDRMPGHINGRTNPFLFLASRRQVGSCHVLTLNRSWEDLAAYLPRRKQVARNRRQLTALGEVTFEIATSPERRRAVFNAIMEQKAQWYKNRLGYDLFERPGFRTFFQGLVENLAPLGSLQLAALKLDSRIISAHMGFVVGDRFYQYLPTYAAEFQRFGPGRLLHEHLISWCFSNSIRFFDFGIGDEAYKDQYCDVIEPLYRKISPVTIKGYLHVLAWNFHEQVRTWKKRVWK